MGQVRGSQPRGNEGDEADDPRHGNLIITVRREVVLEIGRVLGQDRTSETAESNTPTHSGRNRSDILAQSVGANPQQAQP